MSDLKEIGNFRELPYGSKQADSIEECKGKLTFSNINGLIKYLKSGEIVAVSPGLSRDFFDESLIGPLTIYTDGTWEWTSDLVHYVEKHRVALPEEFLSFVLRRI